MKKKFQIHEKRDSKNFSGKMTPGSGSKSIKGDVQTDDLLIECKCTEKSQYILKKEVLQKLKSQAFNIGKTPILSLEICDEKWMLIEANFLHNLLEELK